jgi:hypothetical protein
MNVTHGDTLLDNTCNVKFLGLIIDSTFPWKDHINQLAMKLSSAVYAIRTLYFVMSQMSLLMTYNMLWNYILNQCIPYQFLL